MSKRFVAILLAVILVGSVATASAASLKYGSKGPLVTSLQNTLKNAGYFTGAVDGKYGYSTWEAVWKFQSAKGMVADGLAGSKTLSALGLDSGSTGTAATGGVTMGAKGDKVVSIQNALKSAGYYAGVVDGSYGYSTWEAVWRFQRDKGLPADGVAGSGTMAALGLSSSGAQAVILASELVYGSKNVSVSSLQAALKAAGYYNGAIDGEYGYTTWEAVWRFQRDKGLKSDGVAGNQTLALLNIGSSSSGAVAPTLQVGGKGLTMGSTGPTVLSLQSALKKIGYYGGAVDGSYGYATWEAVWRFQRDKGLAADGVAGSQTLGLLGVGYTQSTSATLPSGGLAMGQSGEAVRAVQTALKNLGYYKGTIDGSYGYSTFEAVWWFQKNSSIAADGKVGNATWNLLFGGGYVPRYVSSTTVLLGSRGDAVVAVQRRLKSLGYYSGRLDGVFGTNTEAAVRNFQSYNSLTVDGVVGSRTIAALNSTTAVAKP